MILYIFGIPCFIKLFVSLRMAPFVLHLWKPQNVAPLAG